MAEFALPVKFCLTTIAILQNHGQTLDSVFVELNNFTNFTLRSASGCSLSLCKLVTAILARVLGLRYVCQNQPHLLSREFSDLVHAIASAPVTIRTPSANFTLQAFV